MAIGNAKLHVLFVARKRLLEAHGIRNYIVTGLGVTIAGLIQKKRRLIGNKFDTFPEIKYNN